MTKQRIRISELEKAIEALKQMVKERDGELSMYATIVDKMQQDAHLRDEELKTAQNQIEWYKGYMRDSALENIFSALRVLRVHFWSWLTKNKKRE